MQRIRKTIDIKAPVQSVFDYLTNPVNLPGIWPSMVEVSNVATKADGSRDFDWVYKMAGLHFKGHAKSEEHQPGKLSRMRNEAGIPSTFRWTFQGLDGSGTRLTVEVEYTIPTPVIGKIAEALVAKMNDREMDTMLANLKEVMEGAIATTRVATQPQH